MRTMSSPTPPVDPTTAQRYRALVRRLDSLIEAVEAARNATSNPWESPSPCAGWSAVDVLEHLTRTERDFLSGFDLAPEEDPRSDDREPALRRWAQVSRAAQRVLDDPDLAVTPHEGFFGPSTFEQTFGSFYVFDVLVHTWDIARATGLTGFETMPVTEVERCFAQMRAMGDNLRMEGICGPEIEVPEGADLQTRFLAFLGRRP